MLNKVYHVELDWIEETSACKPGEDTMFPGRRNHIPHLRSWAWMVPLLPSREHNVALRRENREIMIWLRRWESEDRGARKKKDHRVCILHYLEQVIYLTGPLLPLCTADLTANVCMWRRRRRRKRRWRQSQSKGKSSLQPKFKNNFKLPNVDHILFT